MTFAGGTGSLVLNDPAGFSGQIVGLPAPRPTWRIRTRSISSGSTTISTLFAETYNSQTGLLTVTDGTQHGDITFGDFNATLDFASDGHGGTLITDPPATGSDPRQ